MNRTKNYLYQTQPALSTEQTQFKEKLYFAQMACERKPNNPNPKKS